MVAQTRGKDQPSPKKLGFHDKLVGKGLATDALLKKLKTLHGELQAIEQEHIDVASLSGVRKELINTSLLLHKDRGVKAYTACNLAELLRLYAPDAPYTHTELRDMFQFFFRQLAAGLRAADAPYYNQYFDLLESLSTVKSVVLVCDLPAADTLMSEIFRDLFALVRRDLPRKAEMFMADILIALIDECQTLPAPVLDTLLAQFLDKNPTMEQPAYRLAVQVCNATSDKLQRHVCTYFTDIIVAAPSSDTDADYSEIETAHMLVRQLHRGAPSLLHSVIPQLEEELRAEDATLRAIATKALGDMFGDTGGAELVKKYLTTWTIFLGRQHDKVVSIRLRFVEALRGLLVTLPDQRGVLEEAVEKKLLDPDEKVRAAVCRVFGQLDYETALHHVSVTVLHSLVGRGIDKKSSVRAEALISAGKLYSAAYPEIESGEPAVVDHFAWIPNDILSHTASSYEARAVVEQAIFDYVLPLPVGDVDEAAWTERLLGTMRHIDSRSVTALLALSGIKLARPTLFEHYLLSCKENNGGIIDENEEAITRRLNTVIQRVAGALPDPQKAKEDLETFAKLNENRLYKLMQTCMDTQTDLKGLIKATNEFKKRLDQSAPAILPTMSIILRRASLHIVNQSSVPTLLRAIHQGSQDAENAKMLLACAAKHCPAIFRPHGGELAKALADERKGRSVEVALQALAAGVEDGVKGVLGDKRAKDRIMRYAMGKNARQAKFAARILANSKREQECETLVENIADALPDAEDEQLVAHIAVLAELAHLTPDAFEQKSDVIMTFLVQQVLMTPLLPDPNEMDDGEEWIEDHAVPPRVQAKVLAMKVCRWRCLAHADEEDALALATPVLKMFSAVLQHGGSLTAKAATQEDVKVKSRVRLQAAVSLLHLWTVPAFANHASKSFINLALTVQASCYQVREHFLRKLIMLLTSRRLEARFNVIPFITAHDPEQDIKSAAAGYIEYAKKNLSPALRVEQLEFVFVRLLHLLAHHPDFANTQEHLPDMAVYVEFYLKLIATIDNVSLLYCISAKLKGARDKESEEFSQNLWVMSELAQLLIKKVASARTWAIPSYPGKVKLPSDILKPFPTPEAAAKNFKTVYLAEETASWLEASVKESKAAAAAANAKEKRRVNKAPKAATGKRKTAPKTNGHTRRPRATKKRRNSSDNENDEPPASDSSGGDDASEDKSGGEDDAAKGQRENLGRTARTRANDLIKKQTRKETRPRLGSDEDEDDDDA